MEYTVIGKKTSEAFIFTVNLYIQEGWKPVGGVSIDKEGNYLQAMTRGV